MVNELVFKVDEGTLDPRQPAPARRHQCRGPPAEAWRTAHRRKEGRYPNPPQALFGCCRIHLNPHVLEWIEVEFSSSSTLTQLNTCGLIRISLHPNKASTK